MQKTEHYITEAILKALDEGVAPWRKPWVTRDGGHFRNLKSGKPYRGMNIMLLACAGFDSPYWVTYKQAKELGGEVRKGEKATKIIFWKILEKDVVKGDGTTGVDKIPLMRYYNVFNVEQCDGLEVPEPQPEPSGFDPIEAAEQIWEGWEGRPTLNHGGSEAYYRPTTDSIQMPKPEDFESPEAYYGTLFHEMGHATGHESRLARKGVTDPIMFGSHTYSQEELIAEITSLLVCGAVGIEQTFDNSVAYIQTWRERIKEDGPQVVIRAAQQAQKAADLLVGSPVEATA